MAMVARRPLAFGRTIVVAIVGQQHCCTFVVVVVVGR